MLTITLCVLTDLPSDSDNRSYDEVVSIIQSQTVILKAIHDFLEEQDFSQILQHRLSSLSREIFRSISSISQVNTSEIKLNVETSATVIYHQMIIAGLDINKIYTVTSPENHSNLNATLDLEYSNIMFENIMMFLEKLLRRIKIDIQTKLEKERISEKFVLPAWNDTFPLISRHDIELEFGADWVNEATSEYQSPFFVTCLEPTFYDQVDPERNGNHYLNFELYCPGIPQPIARGGTREYNYDQLIQKMGTLNINRFNYRNYLLIVAEEQFRPSSGASVNLDRLIDVFSPRK